MRYDRVRHFLDRHPTCIVATISQPSTAPASKALTLPLGETPHCVIWLTTR